MPQVVAPEVLAVRREVERESHIRAAVQTVQKPLDHRTGNETQVLQRSEEVRIDQLPCGAAELAAHAILVPLTAGGFSGTLFKTRAIRASASMFSAREWNVSTSRCRST